VPGFRSGAEPLAVAHDQIVGRALGIELGEGLGLEIGPWRGFHRDLHPGLGFVLIDQFLQVVGRVPFGPEDRQFLRQHGCARRKHQAQTGQHALGSSAHCGPPSSASDGRQMRHRPKPLLLAGGLHSSEPVRSSPKLRATGRSLATCGICPSSPAPPPRPLPRPGGLAGCGAPQRPSHFVPSGVEKSPNSSLPRCRSLP
jgi:hypothetical protein